MQGTSKPLSPKKRRDSTFELPGHSQVHAALLGSRHLLCKSFYKDGPASTAKRMPDMRMPSRSLRFIPSSTRPLFRDPLHGVSYLEPLLQTSDRFGAWSPRRCTKTTIGSIDNAWFLVRFGLRGERRCRHLWCSGGGGGGRGGCSLSDILGWTAHPYARDRKCP